MLKPEQLFLAVKPVDMRRGIDTLTQYVQDTLHASWQEGAAFVFANKSRTRLRVLRWDKHGVWLCARRLHKGLFIWPRTNTDYRTASPLNHGYSWRVRITLQEERPITVPFMVIRTRLGKRSLHTSPFVKNNLEGQ